MFLNNTEHLLETYRNRQLLFPLLLGEPGAGVFQTLRGIWRIFFLNFLRMEGKLKKFHLYNFISLLFLEFLELFLELLEDGEETQQTSFV